MAKMTTVSFDEAITLSLTLSSNRTKDSEWVSTLHALGRILAEDIVCQKNLPSYNNAAMDGFAIKHSDCNKILTIKKTILAGNIVEACLEKDECYKIMTGAKVPDDVDTIVPFEDCLAYTETTTHIPLHVTKGNALRLKGEEQQEGLILLHEGSYITSSTLAMLASQGITHIKVYKKLSIAVFSTGDELKNPWDSANENEIYDINATALIALFTEYGFDAHYCGVIPDNLEKATAYFEEMKAYNALVTSGGVSMGEADYVEKALQSNGFEALFHGINIKPGKPTMLGKMGKTIVASLPGNPLAAYVNAFLFLIPLLKKLQGEKNFNYQFIQAINQEMFKVKSGRVNLVLGLYENGTFKVCNSNKYGSGMITPMHYSNALLITTEETASIEMGKKVNIFLFKPLLTEHQGLFKN
ncbi:MAG: molybdopterin molybdotransferase MoeA [Sulfurospirillaceae bacterium]|nr:molybdopterin molybdotransferase MoeA [Sulfurospirillaceae bacterium]MDD2827793.1 molybdopterin molybdotransferase MoeA [Sulfurospirillaceae bacterium]